MFESQMAECPKCGVEAAQPKKTLEMVGRPDKQGKRLKLKFVLHAFNPPMRRLRRRNALGRDVEVLAVALFTIGLLSCNVFIKIS
ncbi:MAG: hypothetical protein ACP5PQ_06805 [Thermoproteota archaeon]